MASYSIRSIVRVSCAALLFCAASAASSAFATGGSETPDSTKTFMQSADGQFVYDLPGHGGNSITATQLNTCFTSGNCASTKAANPKKIYNYPIPCTGSGGASCTGCWKRSGQAFQRVSDLDSGGNCPTTVNGASSGYYKVFVGYQTECPAGAANCNNGRIMLGCSISKVAANASGGDALVGYNKECFGGSPIIIDPTNSAAYTIALSTSSPIPAITPCTPLSTQSCGALAATACKGSAFFDGCGTACDPSTAALTCSPIPTATPGCTVPAGQACADLAPNMCMGKAFSDACGNACTGTRDCGGSCVVKAGQSCADYAPNFCSDQKYYDGCGNACTSPGTKTCAPACNLYLSAGSTTVIPPAKAKITAEALNSTGVLTFSISPSAGSTKRPSNTQIEYSEVGAGRYTVTVADAATGCVTSTPVNVVFDYHCQNLKCPSGTMSFFADASDIPRYGATGGQLNAVDGNGDTHSTCMWLTTDGKDWGSPYVACGGYGSMARQCTTKSGGKLVGGEATYWLSTEDVAAKLDCNSTGW